MLGVRGAGTLDDSDLHLHQPHHQKCVQHMYLDSDDGIVGKGIGVQLATRASDHKGQHMGR